MLSSNYIQEQMSWTYLRAVVFRSGYDLFIPEVDDHGIDGTIGNRLLSGVNRVDFQLKASTDYELRDTSIRYDLRVQNYNQLIRDDDVPRVLILLTMPVDDGEWLIQSTDELCLRRCAYWQSLMGADFSNNRSTVRVSLPRRNVFNQSGLLNMFTQLGLIR